MKSAYFFRAASITFSFTCAFATSAFSDLNRLSPIHLDDQFHQAFPKKLNEPFTISLLKNNLTGDGCSPKAHFSGNYYPVLLGGLLIHETVYEKYKKAASSVNDPSALTDLMNQIYAGTPTHERFSPFAQKWRNALVANHISIPDDKKFDLTKTDTEIFEQPKFKYWNGFCDAMTFIDGFFPRGLKPVYSKGIYWTRSDLERIALEFSRHIQYPNYGSIGNGYGRFKIDPKTQKRLKTRDFSQESLDDVLPAPVLNSLLLMKENRDSTCLAMDRNPNDETWNELIRRYEVRSLAKLTREVAEFRLSEYRGKSPFASFDTDNHQFYQIDFSLFYGQNHLAALPRDRMTPKELRLSAILETNQKDEIIGGEWLNQNHPDVLWTFGRTSLTKVLFEETSISDQKKFAYLAFIESILKDSIGESQPK